MAYDTELGDQLKTLLGNRPDFSEKKMFGGIAFLYKGKMTVGLMGDRLIVRVVAEKYADLLEEPHVEPMAFTGNKPMKEFIYVDKEYLSGPEDLLPWIDLGLEHAQRVLGEG
jgi:TfoX/Sxy family transcriptional regulator of competence genes